MMDADILIHRRETLWNMVLRLESDSEAAVAVDRPCKDIGSKTRRSLRDWFSLGASEITVSSPAQLCAQLYCMRGGIARGIYLPKDLPACEDGFLKLMVCTDNLRHDVREERIALAEGAEHTFEAYTSARAILKNQKRQAIGQTIIHLLVDRCLRELPEREREHLAQTIRGKDKADPDWLKRLVSEHLQRTRWFWRLYPDLVGYRFRRLGSLSLRKRLLCFPPALAGAIAMLIGSFMAYRQLKSGSLAYWPKAERLGLQPLSRDLDLSLAKSTGSGE
jgi:hypothetical protein